MSIGKPKRLVIISGHPGYIEEQLNVLLDDYMATTWNFQAVGETIIITVVLIHQSEMRKAQLAGFLPTGRGQ